MIDIKKLQNLKNKSFRDETGLFVVEGERAVSEFLSAGMQPVEYYSTDKGTISEKQIERVSSLKTPQGSIAVFKKPFSVFEEIPKNKISLILDGIQDPGNLGTIIRTCDWFGIHNIYASRDTVDCFNSKVVQSTMGAIARVKVFYTDISVLLRNTSVPIYGTFMKNAQNIYDMEGSIDGAVIVLGNEGNGISKEIEGIITNRVTIPSFYNNHIESLNVAVAAAIAISEFTRRR